MNDETFPRHTTKKRIAQFIIAIAMHSSYIRLLLDSPVEVYKYSSQLHTTRAPRNKSSSTVGVKKKVSVFIGRLHVDIGSCSWINKYGASQLCIFSWSALTPRHATPHHSASSHHYTPTAFVYINCIWSKSGVNYKRSLNSTNWVQMHYDY